MSDPALAQRLYGQRALLRSRWLGYVLAITAIAILPLVFNDTYWRTNLTVCAINVLLAIGLDFILGYAGQLNLGHSAFYGLGAYVSTLLIVKLGIPFWVAFIAGVAFAGIAGILLANINRLDPGFLTFLVIPAIAAAILIRCTFTGGPRSSRYVRGEAFRRRPCR